ncbi:long-chain-fatty-acid--CoA ligase [Amycolatopsis antarctica]|uniref:Long-chain-fatty-acid--CoA ligase n=1 Tax=Amycolatopsis antarctica TaxID=1854586 RepID=A0A263D0Y8_9PSEU|nr:long-chain fatty acid--CoA ligase [Amycolatopsis antarctica]OZM71788.1 long-chain-fatty-acid--CoA ligase [Amycolatopsis antarctica]
MNLANSLVTSGDEHAERVALRCGDRSVTYAEFLRDARAAAGFIRGLGAGPGDRIGLVAPNVPAFPAVFYGALLAGCAVVPMNPLLTAREITFFLTDSGARAVFTLSSAADATQEAAAEADIPVVVLEQDGLSAEQLDGTEPVTEVTERDGGDLAVILYTSGTTGKPKGALLTHDNMRSNAATTVDTLVQATPDDVIMGCLPLFHVFGLTCGLNTAVRAGAALALLPRFDPAEALGMIETHRVTIFEGVPTMYAAMLQAPGSFDVGSLRTCLSGGAPLPVEVMRSFEDRFGCEILEGYGLSETSPVASFNHPGTPRKPGSVGVAVRGMEIRLVDDQGNDVAEGEIGEIAIRGEGLMAGYHGRPEATAEAIPDGWFRSGDLARRDEDGYVFIVDRKKQLIIRGGYNVYPREVEEALYEHPAVAEAAVVGLKHQTLGEEVGAAVSVRDGEDFDAEAIQAFVRERVAAYKYPRHIWSVGELPKGPTGKILHREITAPPEVEVE